MFSHMKTPETRAEFERALHFAFEQIMQGKMSFPLSSDDYVNSLKSVRKLPNGRIDFLSVNEFARLHANQSMNMSGMMETLRAKQAAESSTASQDAAKTGGAGRPAAKSNVKRKRSAKEKEKEQKKEAASKRKANRKQRKGPKK